MKVAELHAASWQRLQDWKSRLPHALLLSGVKGLGKLDLALAFAASLLCEDAHSDGTACGACPACQWFLKGNHPDFRLLQPEALRREEKEEGDEEEKKGRGRNADKQEEKSNRSGQEIGIEDVRALDAFLSVGTHRQKMRVILVHPAEAMNRHAANALLKALEEPPSDTLFLLVSNEPMRLLPTLRSRCQQLALSTPDAALAEKFLLEHHLSDAVTWLALAGGAPMLALRLSENAAPWRETFLKFLQQGGQLEVLSAAVTLEKELKAVKGENPLPQMVEWAQKWIIDLTLAAERLPIRFYLAQRAKIMNLSENRRPLLLLRFYRELLQLRRESAHPLNMRLFLEQFFFRYRRLFVE
ncbi:MAG: DNA polymerase III subunit delta' [Zoogloeaceae bacterium]|jgi:DNA polymerase-3 subunit delta'|nr:DNA polymerase III subunit delta' [Zoogloeaceae bacterium]